MSKYDFEKFYTYVPRKRIVHTMGTERSCIVISERHYPGIDADELRCAAILHDITKYHTYEEHVAICREHEVELGNTEKRSYRVLHQLTGSLLAADYGASPEACAAIRCHTTGKADMNALEKPLMFADYIEPSRSYDGVAELRSYYYRLCDLNDPFAVEKSLAFAIGLTITEVLDRGDIIHPDSINARNFLISQCSTR